MPAYSAPPLSTVRCQVGYCDHPFRDHGQNNVCYGLKKIPSGSIVECPCKKFRLVRKGGE